MLLQIVTSHCLKQLANHALRFGDWQGCVGATVRRLKGSRDEPLKFCIKRTTNTLRVYPVRTSLPITEHETVCT
jgi:hypothetical protein